MKNMIFASAICISSLIGFKTYMDHADIKGLCVATTNKESRHQSDAPVGFSNKEKPIKPTEHGLAFYAVAPNNNTGNRAEWINDHGATVQAYSTVTVDEADAELNQDFYSDNAFVSIDADSIVASDNEVNISFQSESAKPNFVLNTGYSDQLMNDFFHANNK